MRTNRLVAWLALSGCLAICAAPVCAQGDASASVSARLVVRRYGRVHQTKGRLVSDATAKELRFEAKDGAMFALPFEHIVAIHQELGERVRKGVLGWTRFHEVTIHSTNPAGEPSFDTVHVSKTDLPTTLAALERATGLSVDRSPASTSFVGLPSHVRLGDTLYITDDAGRTTKGKLTQLSPSTVELQPSGRFDAAAVRSVKVGDSVWDGATKGALLALIPALLVAADECWNGCQPFPGFKVGGLIATGMLIGGAIDAGRMRTAYQQSDGTASRQVRVGAVVTVTEKSVRVAIRF